MRPLCHAHDAKPHGRRIFFIILSCIRPTTVYTEHDMLTMSNDLFIVLDAARCHHGVRDNEDVGRYLRKGTYIRKALGRDTHAAPRAALGAWQDYVAYIITACVSGHVFTCFSASRWSGGLSSMLPSGFGFSFGFGAGTGRPSATASAAEIESIGPMSRRRTPSYSYDRRIVTSPRIARARNVDPLLGPGQGV